LDDLVSHKGAAISDRLDTQLSVILAVFREVKIEFKS